MHVLGCTARMCVTSCACTCVCVCNCLACASLQHYTTHHAPLGVIVCEDAHVASQRGVGKVHKLTLLAQNLVYVGGAVCVCVCVCVCVQGGDHHHGARMNVAAHLELCGWASGLAPQCKQVVTSWHSLMETNTHTHIHTHTHTHTHTHARTQPRTFPPDWMSSVATSPWSPRTASCVDEVDTTRGRAECQSATTAVGWGQ